MSASRSASPRGDVEGVVATLRYNGGAADKLEGTTVPLGREVIDFTLLEPLGVSAHIVPWNFPLGMAIRGAVLKPAEQSPLSARAWPSSAGRRGLPKGALNVVTGLGEEAGEALVGHPLVRGISFTGSIQTGRRIMALAAERTVPVGLELGGRNPMLAFADADLARAAADAAEGAFGNSGQVCSSSSRLLVAPAVKDECIERLRAKAAAVRIGPGREDPDLSPLVSSERASCSAAAGRST